MNDTSIGTKMSAGMMKNQLITVALLGALTLVIVGIGAALSPASLYVSLGLVIAINAGFHFSWYQQPETSSLPGHNRPRARRSAQGSPYRRPARRMPSRTGSQQRTRPALRSRLHRGLRRSLPFPSA